MKKFVFAALAGLFAVSASVAFAQAVGSVTVGVNEQCPAGYERSVPAYDLSGGKWVQTGWVCHSIHR